MGVKLQKYCYHLIRALPAFALISLMWSTYASSAQKPASVAIVLKNDTFTLKTDARTYRQLFEELGISLDDNELNLMGIRLDDELGQRVELSEIEIIRLSSQVSIPPKVVFKLFPTHKDEKVEILSSGKEGLKQLNYAVFMMRGKIVGGRLTTQKLLEPEPKIVAIFQPMSADYIPGYETILRMRRLTAREFKPPARYKKVLVMEATAYSPEEAKPSWGDPYSTAIGLRAGYGVVAVDPKVIPLKTRLYIEGYGYAIAGDTGSAIKGMRIDLGFETAEECIEFGRRKVKVYVLD